MPGLHTPPVTPMPVSPDAPDQSAANGGRALCFGRFRLLLEKRTLLESGRPVPLGSRAVELLTVLLEHRGELVGKQTLMERVWPTTVVEDINLRVQMAALRKALGHDDEAQGYIATVPGRGYRFTADVRIESPPDATEVRLALGDGGPSLHNLPPRLTRPIGQEAAILGIFQMLRQGRLVSIVGPGGIGKTTIALEIAEQFVGALPDGVRFVDLGALSAGSSICQAVFEVLGVSTDEHRPLAKSLAMLSDKRLLVLLDNCEHMIAEAALMAEQLLRASPHIRVLATSREPLRAEGENVYRLPPLRMPDEITQETLAPEEAQTYPAIQLFVRRASAGANAFALQGDDVRLVAQLCRQLDGNPFAIELAAARVPVLGLNGVAEMLRDRLHLLTNGRRTAEPRQRTLWAMLDWSHTLLPPEAQTVLRRVSVFRGSFSLAGAAAVAGIDGLSEGMVAEQLLVLADHSLLSVDVEEREPVYRLLELTRVYAAQCLADSGDMDAVAHAHARHQLALYSDPAIDESLQKLGHLKPCKSRHSEDLRKALDWCFSPAGDETLGISLMAAVAPLAYELSLMYDFRTRLEHTLNLLTRRGEARSRVAACLHTALGSLRNHCEGPGPLMRLAYRTAHDIAAADGDAKTLTAPTVGLWALSYTAGDFNEALAVASRLQTIARARGDHIATTVARRMLAQALHMQGRYEESTALIDEVLAYPQARFPLAYGPSQTCTRVTMRILLARTFWIRGRPDDARAMAEEALGLAEQEHLFAECLVLSQASIPVALWRGDRDHTAELVNRLRRVVQRYPGQYWSDWIEAFDALQAEAALLRALPVDHLRLDLLGTCDPRFVHPLTIERVRRRHVGWCAPEILRAQAITIMQPSQAVKDRLGEAHALLTRALTLAQRQGAVGWELRCATTLARLWMASRPGEAVAMVEAALGKVVGGAETRDVASARSLLNELQRCAALSSQGMHGGRTVRAATSLFAGMVQP